MNGFKGELCAADEIYSKETTSQVARDLVERKRQIIISLRRILFYNKKGIVWIPSFSFCFLKKFLTRLLTPIQCIPNFTYIPQTHTRARAYKRENDFELRLSPCTASFNSVCNTWKVFKNISPTNIFWSDWATKFKFNECQYFFAFSKKKWTIVTMTAQTTLVCCLMWFLLGNLFFHKHIFSKPTKPTNRSSIFD